MPDLRVTATLLLLTALGACRSPASRQDAGPRVVPGELVESGAAPSEDHSVELALEQLIRQSRVENGVRVVDLELRNRSQRELAFAFRVEWLDRRGERVSDPSERWKHLVLPAEAAAPLRLTAPSPRAESWRLRAAATAQ
ncbi:MAG: DUF1425 domain-containing protein [Planctomycetes bacterium]|nr:DUF1425 domain-containing protein [Planctomycetota bacterium]